SYMSDPLMRLVSEHFHQGKIVLGIPLITSPLIGNWSPLRTLGSASLSAGCNPVMIEQVPQYAAEGQSVLLQVHNLPEDLQMFSWFKGTFGIYYFMFAEYNSTMNSVTQGPAYSGRETLYTNGSLLLLDIKPVMKPYLQVTHTTATVQRSVLFSCILFYTGISIRWIFNNQSLQLTERMTLSPMKCRLRIDPVRREDAGEYKCEVSNPVSSKTSLPIRLIVMNDFMTDLCAYISGGNFNAAKTEDSPGFLLLHKVIVVLFICPDSLAV
ncbi:Pregnancy-specific glycoprotein 28, partial [Sigmodon hispidus]